MNDEIKQPMDEKTKKLLDSFPRRVPEQSVAPLLFTNYSRKENVYQAGDQLYGNWSQSFAGACSSGIPNSIRIGSIISLEDVGDCSPDTPVIMCVHR